MTVEVLYKKDPSSCIFTYIVLFLATFSFLDMCFPKQVYQLKARIVFKNINLI